MANPEMWEKVAREGLDKGAAAKTRMVLKALAARHTGRFGDPADAWAYFEEVRLGTGFAKPGNEEYDRRAQRIDAWAMHLWPSKGFLKIGYEVKVSRQDLQREIERPEKRQPAMAVCNQFFFAAPKGLINEFEVPEGCGLIEVEKSTRSTLAAPSSRIVVRAPHRGIEDLPESFVASLLRRQVRAER